MRASRHFIVSLIVTGALCGAASAETFGFWPGKGASSAPGFKRMEGHPCGEVAEADVARLPSPDNVPLRPELVVELSAQGKVIRRWPAPVDSSPRAVKGEELLVALYGKGFWIRPDGRFRKASKIPAANDTPAECDLTDIYGNSAYIDCSVFRDLATGARRKLGYQDVCT